MVRDIETHAAVEVIVAIANRYACFLFLLLVYICPV